MTDNGHILIVDDQREICDLVQEYLSGEGYRVSTAQDGAEMRKVMAQSPVDLVILDLMLPGEDGLTLARSSRRRSRAIAARGPAGDRRVTCAPVTHWCPSACAERLIGSAIPIPDRYCQHVEAIFPICNIQA